jgi:hypothetical protein
MDAAIPNRSKYVGHAKCAANNKQARDILLKLSVLKHSVFKITYQS